MIDTSSGRVVAGTGYMAGEALVASGGSVSLDSPPATEPTRFLARQPILDLKQKLHGYAMIQRTPPSEGMDSYEAARETIDNYRLFMPQASTEKGFVQCTREMLLSGLLETLPSQNSILRIPAAVEPDSDVVASCAVLRKKGYRLALEGAVPGDTRNPLLDLADYLAIDFQANDREKRRDIFRMVNGLKIKPVANKVEKAEEIEMARREGCQYFQGYFLSSSAIAARRVIPTNQVICLRLMSALSEEATETKEIESMVMMDQSLCYQLLRRVNSVAYSLNSRVTSIRNALVIIGNDEFRRLVTVALADVFASTQSKTLITIALERAKFCEILAPRLREPGPKLYLLGMLSLIDIILQVPMTQVMDSLPIDAGMKAALKGDQSTMGTALNLVRSYQGAHWEKCDVLQERLEMSEGATSRTYMESVHWTAQVLSEQ